MKWVTLDSFLASDGVDAEHLMEEFSTSNLGNKSSFDCGLCAITCETMSENELKALTFFPFKKIINDYIH